MKKIILYLLFLVFSFPVAAQLNTDRIMANGRFALYYKDYFLSIQYFNQVIKVKPHLPEPYMYRAFAKLYLDEYLGAEQDCSQALELNPFLPDAYLCRAYARLGQKKYEGAIRDFDKAIDFSPENMSLFIGRGATKMEMKQYDEALEDYSHALKRDSKNIYAYYERGRLNAQMEDTIAAFNDFSKIIEVDKHAAVGYSARGLLNLRAGKYEEAIADLNEALMLEENAGDYINRALARYHVYNLRGAMADYDRALELNPNEFLGYYNRGLLRAQVGENTRAIEDFDMVLRFNPKDYSAILNRALLRASIGDMSGAIEDYTAIIDRYPEFTPAYYGRSAAKAQLGQKKAADLDYMTAYHLENSYRSQKKNTDESKTRDEDDDDINNYKKIIVIDTEKEKDKLQYKDNNLRGNIQHVNVEIKPESSFFLSYYSAEKKVTTPMIHYYKAVEEYNKKMNSPENLKITNQELQLSSDMIFLHLNMINGWSQQLEEKGANADIYFIRAINYSLVQDFENAIDSYNKAIALRSNNMLYYFSRANIRLKMLNYTYASGNGEAKTNSSKDIYLKTEYEFIVRDYNKTIELDPDFIYAYFNRGNLFLANDDYNSAINDYTEAIKKEADFAEAYFNRGLAYIKAGEKQKGIADLSKAGELGIHTAYNIIKRYS